MSLTRSAIIAVLTLGLILSAGLLIAAQPASAKPLSEADLVKLVELGIDGPVIVAKVKKDGIAFNVDEAVLNRLKAGGASREVLESVQQESRTKPNDQGAVPAKAVSYQDVLKLLELGLDQAAILKRVEQSPTIFTLDADQIIALKNAGATPTLLEALQGKRAPAEPTGDITDFAILLDCSGSMMEKTKEGQTKMVVAKRVVADLIQKIPDGLRLTFIIYGHDRKLECQAVQVVRELAEIDAAGKSELASAISALQPAGATPIALALRTAGKELAKNGAACGLVLISDGKESCKGDPAAEAAALAKNLKLSFGVNVIGFDVGADRTSLEGIAKAGNGKYFNADSAAELTAAVQKLRQELEQRAAPALKQRDTRTFAAAGKAAKPGAFVGDAPVIGVGEYKGTLAMLEAHYYQVQVRKGQSLRAVGIVQKTPYQAQNSIINQTFSLTLYSADLAVIVKEGSTVSGNPTAPVTFRANGTASADGIVYVAIAASDNHDPDKAPVDTSPAEPKPSIYTLRIRLEGDAAEGGAIDPVARVQVNPGTGFDQAGELKLPSLATADLKIGEVLFYRVPVKKGENLRVSAAFQKPWYEARNKIVGATYTLTVYDDDQVQVAQKKLEVAMNPPDAYSIVVAWPVELGGNAYLGVSCENSGQEILTGAAQVKPGRLAVQVSTGKPAAQGGNAFEGAKAEDK